MFSLYVGKVYIKLLFVNSFNYIGTAVSRTGNFFRASRDVYTHAEKAVCALLRHARNGTFPVDVMLHFIT